MSGVVTAPIPPRTYQPYSVDVQISVWPNGDRYVAYVQAEGSSCTPIPINLTPHSLQALNSKLQSTIGRAVLTPNSCNVQQELAEAGNYAFKQVFGDEKSQQAIQSALRLIGTDGIVQITTEDFALPWDLLYSNDVTSPIAFENFWGMRFLIHRVLVVQKPRRTDFVSQIVRSNRPAVGLLTNRGLRHVAEKERPFFAKLHRAQRIRLRELRPLDPERRLAELQVFLRFWQKNLDLAHLACHACAVVPPDDSYVVLSNNFRISLQDMTVYSLSIGNMPLVVINGCQTANFDPLYVSSMAGKFLEGGARGVIATECPVPDRMAAEFTELLYTHLLDGEELGLSLMETRRELLKKHGSPAGLLYALYAAPNFRFVKEQQDA